MKKKKGFGKEIIVQAFPPEFCKPCQERFIQKEISYLFLHPIEQAHEILSMKVSKYWRCTVEKDGTTPVTSRFRQIQKQSLLEQLSQHVKPSEAGLVFYRGSIKNIAEECHYMVLNQITLSFLETKIIDGSTGKLIRHLFENNLKRFSFPECLPVIVAVSDIPAVEIFIL